MKSNNSLTKFVLLFFLFTGYCFTNEKISNEDIYLPYGVNGWVWDLARMNLMKKAHMYYYRIMLHWATVEPKDGELHYPSDAWRGADYEFDLYNFKAAYYAAGDKKKIRVSLCIYDSPEWARKDPNVVLSFDIKEYIDFVITSLKYFDEVVPGLVEAVEVQNEEPTGVWKNDKPPVHGTDERDPSWYYSNILKETYKAIKEYNPDILVVMDGIWAGSYHHLDELYQTGCKGYFDRINFHYYAGGDIGAGFGKRTGPAAIRGEHFPTVLGYLKYIADSNNDDIPIWLTEFGWRLPEKIKSKYIVYVLDTCRKSGYVERTNYYEFTPYPDDPISLVDNITLADDPKDHRDEFGWVGNYVPKKSYYAYKKYAEKYPVWNKKEKVDYIPAAKNDAEIINSEFESGKDGWIGEFESDSNTKHSGNYSAKMKPDSALASKLFKVEPQRLYEVSFWVKINGEKPDSVICLPSARYFDSPGSFIHQEKNNCWGIVDTRNYPNGWRRVGFPAVPMKGTRLCELKFEVKGEGEVYIDDVKMNRLDLTYLNPK